MKALLIQNAGPQASLAPGDIEAPEPGSEELLVRVKATALNRADLLQKRGRYPVPPGASPVLGLEMAGTVEQTGSNTSGWQKGDRVFGLLDGGGYAEYATIHHLMALPIPRDMDFETAAAMPETFLTAHQALFWLGELQPEESVLIHAGASGVGTSAIQLARETGARILVTAGSEEKLQICRRLGAETAINYRSQDFDERVEQETGGEGVQLIIDVVGAPYWKPNMRSIQLDGRIVYLGMLGGVKGEMDLSYILRKRLTLRGSMLRNRPQDYKIRLTRDWADFALPLIEQGRIGPVIDRVFDWTRADEAHRHMEDNRNAGKIVLTGM